MSVAYIRDRLAPVFSRYPIRRTGVTIYER